MNIKTTLYASTMIEDFRERACPELSATQVLTGVLNLILEKGNCSFDEIMRSEDSILVAYIRQHIRDAGKI